MHKYDITFQEISTGKRLVFERNAPTIFTAERDAWAALEELKGGDVKEKWFKYSSVEKSTIYR